MKSMKYLIALVGALTGALCGYGIARLLSTEDGPTFAAVATAVVGGVFLSAAFSGVYAAFTAK